MRAAQRLGTKKAQHRCWAEGLIEGYPLNVVVQSELERMRTQADRVHFLLALVLDVGLDQLFGEDIALEHEGMVLLQAVERFIERARHGWNLRQLLRPEVVDVLIERLTWIDLVLDAV